VFFGRVNHHIVCNLGNQPKPSFNFVFYRHQFKYSTTGRSSSQA
jgi:hypothetical protein